VEEGGEARGRREGNGRRRTARWEGEELEVGGGAGRWAQGVGERERGGASWAGVMCWAGDWAEQERKERREKKEGRWAGLKKKEKERCLFFSLTKAKDLFDIKTFQI
jgi:hypothetical protein